jgi:hypothetical protein
MRNPLSEPERRAIRLGSSRPFTALARLLARAAGARDHPIRWRPAGRRQPWFNNQLATLELDGRGALVRLERPVPGTPGPPQLEEVAERRLA